MDSDALKTLQDILADLYEIQDAGKSNETLADFQAVLVYGYNIISNAFTLPDNGDIKILLNFGV